RNAVCLFPLIAAIVLATPRAMLAQQEVTLAMKGYDPVAYFDAGKPTLGLAEIENEHDGLRYPFAKSFSRPTRRAMRPSLAIIAPWRSPRASLSSPTPKHWLIHDGKLYLFGSPPPAGPVLFQKELTANIAKANQNGTLLAKH